MNKFLMPFIMLCALASPALPQSTTNIDTPNASYPVEATADNLIVSQDTNSAIFSGNAKAVQGVFDLQADTITVFFEDGGGNINSVKASGQVKFTNGLETAEGNVAEFDVISQIITVTGSVILRQALTTLTGNMLTYDIKTGHSQMSGNVKTIFTPK